MSSFLVLGTDVKIHNQPICKDQYWKINNNCDEIETKRIVAQNTYKASKQYMPNSKLNISWFFLKKLVFNNFYHNLLNIAIEPNIVIFVIPKIKRVVITMKANCIS